MTSGASRLNEDQIAERGARMARRDDREYREYLREEQRSQRGCIARRMQPEFHHGLLAAPAPLRHAAIAQFAASSHGHYDSGRWQSRSCATSRNAG